MKLPQGDRDGGSRDAKYPLFLDLVRPSYTYDDAHVSQSTSTPCARGALVENIYRCGRRLRSSRSELLISSAAATAREETESE